MDSSVTYFTPFASDKNYGAEVNRLCAECSTPYIAIMDGDSLLFDDFGSRIEQILDANPDGDIFGCTTNRLKYPDQLYQNTISENNDILYHKGISDLLWKECGTACVDASRPIAGLFLLFRKEVWRNIKFHDGLFKIDFLWTQEALDANYKIKIACGLYVFHFYRLDKNIRDFNHLL